MVDSDDKAEMGFLYDAMDRAKLEIKKNYDNEYRKWWKMIDHRWNRQLHKDIHAAGYFLNPKIQYSSKVCNDAEVIKGTKNVIARLLPDIREQICCEKEMETFRLRFGGFGSVKTQHAIKLTTPGSTVGDAKVVKIKRQTTFIFQHTSHPWTQNKVLVWMICFISQFWRSINKADYMALRLGFILNHKLQVTYNFHNYMLRSMVDEFRDIVGISVPLWGYAILCILLNVHGTNAYFWLSFIPGVLIMIVGTKLHHIVTKLALEVRDENQCSGNQLKLRDELFWFGKPEVLLWLIQLISFQNAFVMATLIWSVWEINGPSCFMKNHLFVLIRLTSGILFQFWCSYFTFPLYVIITQMGSKARKALVAESVRESLHNWMQRAKHRSSHEEGSYAKMMIPSMDVSMNDSIPRMFNMVYDQNEDVEPHEDDSPLQVPSCSDAQHGSNDGDINGMPQGLHVPSLSPGAL